MRWIFTWNFGGLGKGCEKDKKAEPTEYQCAPFFRLSGHAWYWECAFVNRGLYFKVWGKRIHTSLSPSFLGGKLILKNVSLKNYSSMYALEKGSNIKMDGKSLGVNSQNFKSKIY